MWIYSQSLGTIYAQEAPGQDPVSLATGYSGHGVGLNNPTMQCVEDLGPIPRGDFTIGAPVTGPTDYALPLTPKAGTDMCSPARTSFYIHGDYRRNEPPRQTNAASHGCIIFPLNVRESIWQSGDTDLRVIDYAPRA